MSEGDLGSRKSLFVVVVVVGCFAVLWPKVLHPMMVGPTSHHRIKPNSLDKGCCDVISDIDINTIKIINELCYNIIQQSDTKPLRGQDIVKYCRTEILNQCGIDISAVLQEQVRLGHPFKRIVDELRSFNGSSCLKYKFGISPWSLGVPHKVTINLTPISIRQERPAHIKPEMLHPALREKGSAISQSFPSTGKTSHVKYVDGRPGPIPGMRPPMGGGHIQSQKTSNSMGIIMPLYTIGIVIFFSYTLMKVLFRKKPEGPGAPLYPPVEPSPIFRKEVFESQKSKACNGTPSSKLVVNAMTALLDEVDHELEAQRRINEKEQHTVLANGSAKQSHDQPSVKILGMETTASCEGGQKWSRPNSPVIPTSPPPPPEPTEPPQEIYLEGALPAQSRLLVADAITEPEMITNEDPAVVLASKMTLSVISSDMPEANERFLQQNGDLNTTENEEEALEESKYTTASCATAAESDLSEDDQTDDEMIDEIDKLPECVVDNGIQEIGMDNTDDEDEIEIDVEDEEVEEEEDEEIEVEEVEEEEVEEEEDLVDEPKQQSKQFERDILNDINDNTKTIESNEARLQTQNTHTGSLKNENSEIFSNVDAKYNVQENDNVNETNQRRLDLQNNDSNVNAISEHIDSLSSIIDDIVNSGVDAIKEETPP